MKAKIWNSRWWTRDTDERTLDKEMEERLIAAGFEIVGKATHHFQPQGWTAAWIIAESHLALHTFPEEGKTYIELSSCNKKKQDTFEREMQKRAKTRRAP